MLLWHLGLTLLLFRAIFQDPKVDIRFLFAGAVLPDAIDITFGTLVEGSALDGGERWMHTLVAPTLIAIVVLLATRRGRRRRAWMALVVAMFFHLLIDGMWTKTETFLWPAFGLTFTEGPGDFWGGLFARAANDPWRWLAEVAGLAYLAWAWRKAGLSDRDRRVKLARDGRLAERS